jgi:hypothetical protein
VISDLGWLTDLIYPNRTQKQNTEENVFPNQQETKKKREVWFFGYIHFLLTLGNYFF